MTINDVKSLIIQTRKILNYKYNLFTFRKINLSKFVHEELHILNFR